MRNTSSAALDAASGAAAGVSAAFLMNCFQIAWGKASKALSDSDRGEQKDESGEPATVKAVEKFQGMISGRPLPEGERQVAGNLLHYGFGAFLGAVYALAARRRPAVRAGYGTIYGGAVSLIADEALIPAAGLSPPPTEAPPSSHVYGFISHLVFGAALEGSYRLIERAMATDGERRALAAES